MVHDAHDGKYSKVIEPGVDLSSATQASAAEPSNINQPVIVVSCLDMYHTNVLMYHTMVLLAPQTKVRR
jgi:hypothetical protein